MDYELIGGPCDGEIISIADDVNMVVKISLGTNHAYFVEGEVGDDESTEEETLERNNFFADMFYDDGDKIPTMIHVGQWDENGNFQTYTKATDSE